MIFLMAFTVSEIPLRKTVLQTDTYKYPISIEKLVSSTFY